MSLAYYLGFDPGGQVAGTGVALLTIGGETPRCVTGCVDSVDDAFNWSLDRLAGQTPNAAGLDTFLFWETRKGGWRSADEWLRKRYVAVRSSVLSSNSAHGSMSIQGMSLAMLIRARWPQVDLIESHPKVLYWALTAQRYDWPSDMAIWLRNQMDCLTAEISNEHCWDAALSAWTAFKGHTRCWKRDLRELSRAPIEPAGRCAYWWPE